MDAAVSALTSYLPGSNAELLALLARAAELQALVRNVASTGVVSATDLALIEAKARATLTTERPEPVLPVDPPSAALGIRPLDSERSAGAASELEGGISALTSSTCNVGDPTLLAQTPEVQFTQELDALLTRLQNDPLLVYQFVRDEIRFTPYYGSRRASSYVLETLAGNDFDKASLLIAAYRRLGIPACYVRGTIGLRPGQAAAWLGVDSDFAARTILFNAFIPQSVLGDVRVEHVWVEAYLDVADYRGTGNGPGGKNWVPLAPAFQRLEQNGGPNLAAEMSFNGDAFLSTMISGTAQGEPADTYMNSLRATVASNHPGQQVDEVMWEARPVADLTEVLPLSPPFRVVNRIEESSEVPESFRHKMTVAAGSLAVTTNFSAVAGKRLTIAYVPATPADEAIVASFGNIFDTPANLINVRAELNLDGAVVGSGSARPFGSIDTVSITIAANGYPTESSFTGTDQYALVAAGLNAVVWIPGGGEGRAAQSHANVFRQGVESIGTPGFDSDETLGEALFITGLEYFRQLAAFRDVTARSKQAYALNGYVGAIVSPEFVLFQSGGQTVGVDPRGIRVDARSLNYGFVDKVTASTSSGDLWILNGLHDSSSEHIVLEELWGVPAVSATKVLQLANDSSVPILLIDNANRATLVPQLTHPATTVAVINSYLDAGFAVRVPRDPITHHDWTGTGFRAEFGDGRSHGILSGGLFGGSIAEISEQLQELVRSGEITQADADAFLFALFDRIRQPVDDAVTSRFGQRRDPFTGQPGKFHEGVDFRSVVNTEVRSVADGLVEVRYSSASFGFTVIVNHGADAVGNTYYTLHAHNDSFVANLNDFVSQGDTLARSGNTGRSTNPHVHFEVRVVPPGVLGPVPDASGAPTNGAFFDPDLAVDPLDFAWPDLTLQCTPGC